MYHLADSIAKLSRGRENWYIGREGVPVDDSSGEKQPCLTNSTCTLNNPAPDIFIL